MRFSKNVIGLGLALLVSSSALATPLVPYHNTHGAIELARAGSRSSFHVSTPSINRPSYSAPSMRSTPSAPSSPSIGRPVHNAPPTTGAGTSSPSIGRPAYNGTSPNRPGAPAVASKPPLPRSAVETAMSKGQSASALAAFHESQIKYKAPPVMGPQTRQAAQSSPVWQQYGSRWNNADSFYASRRSALSGLPPSRAIYWTSPPIWISNGPSAYGTFSSAFLGSLLGNATGNALWYYSHRDDEAVMQWHAAMMTQAVNNSELQQQIDNLNAQVAQLEQQHAAVDPNVLPDGIQPSMVVSDDVVLQATSAEGGLSFLDYLGITVGVLLLAGLLFMLLRPRRRSTAFG